MKEAYGGRNYDFNVIEEGGGGSKGDSSLQTQSLGKIRAVGASCLLTVTARVRVNTFQAIIDSGGNSTHGPLSCT